MYYEIVFLLRGDLSPNQVEDISQKYQTLLTKNYQGVVSKVEYWGLRSLAYKINKNKKAHYCLFNVQVSYEGLKELQRLMGVNENVLRSLVIKLDALNDEPSFMMKNANNFSPTNEEVTEAEPESLEVAEAK